MKFKPYDLIRLSSDYGDEGICVASISTPEQWWIARGTPALFLGEYRILEGNSERKFKILTEGHMGWIYESECEELIDEAG